MREVADGALQARCAGRHLFAGDPCRADPARQLRVRWTIWSTTNSICRHSMPSSTTTIPALPPTTRASCSRSCCWPTAAASSPAARSSRPARTTCCQPSYTHIARFVRELGSDIQALFSQVLQSGDRIGLIGKAMFVIDGVKLPTNASKERSGTHAELAHRADRLDQVRIRHKTNTATSSSMRSASAASPSCSAKPRSPASSSPGRPRASTPRGTSSRAMSPTPTAPRWPRAKA